MSDHLEYDPIMRINRNMYEDADGEFVVQSTQDVEGIIEANKASMAATDEHAPWGDLARIGSIPLSVYFQLKRDGVIDVKGNVNDDTALLKWLQDPANRKFKTRPGRLI